MWQKASVAGFTYLREIGFTLSRWYGSCERGELDIEWEFTKDQIRGKEFTHSTSRISPSAFTPSTLVFS